MYPTAPLRYILTILVLAMLGVLVPFQAAKAIPITIDFIEASNEVDPVQVIVTGPHTFPDQPTREFAGVVIPQKGFRLTESHSCVVGCLIVILESPGGLRSDEVGLVDLPVDDPRGPGTFIVFFSDPSIEMIPLPDITIIEDGTLQPVFQRSNAAGDTLIIRVQSDVDVPEPSTWLLFGTGLLGLLAYGWRRRKQAA